jgi:hypothetical protein
VAGREARDGREERTSRRENDEESDCDGVGVNENNGTGEEIRVERN